jgi:hypothetical protein
MRGRWHEALHELGGDPSIRDWTKFRCLRRDTELDWSDWLAQLIEDSTTGRFASALFGRFEAARLSASYALPLVLREVPQEGYRADVVIEWANDSTYTHIEVKVGDPNLDKTLETALALQRREHPRRARSDYILVLPEQSEAWSQACERVAGMAKRVRQLTWTDVAWALRQALASPDREPVHWRVWAHAFCGAIEQQLLRLPSGPLTPAWLRGLKAERLTTAERLFRPLGED